MGNINMPGVVHFTQNVTVTGIERSRSGGYLNLTVDGEKKIFPLPNDLHVPLAFYWKGKGESSFTIADNTDLENYHLLLTGYSGNRGGVSKVKTTKKRRKARAPRKEATAQVGKVEVKIGDHVKTGQVFILTGEAGDDVALGDHVRMASLTILTKTGDDHIKIGEDFQFIPAKTVLDYGYYYADAGEVVIDPGSGENTVETGNVKITQK